VNAPEGPLYRPLLYCLSLALLAAGALLMIQMVAALIGPFRLADLGAQGPRGRVALWMDAPATGIAQARLVRFRTWLPGPTQIRAAPPLAALDPGEVAALLVSEPRTLSAAEVEALERYLAEGGGVVVTGSVGVRDREGGWRGYDLMQKLLGGVAVTPVEAGGVVAARRGVLSAPLLPGQAIALLPEPGLPAVESADAELRFADPTGGPGPAASLRRRFGHGRLAWLAVGPERGAAGAAGERPLADVLGAALAWVARRPIVEILAWPGGAPFAAAPASPDARGAAEATSVLAQAAAAGSVAWLPVSGAEGVLARAGRDGAWLATRAELSSWLLQRSSLEATLRSVGPKRLLVSVTNRAGRPVRGVVLRVHLNERLVRAAVEPTALLQERPGMRFRPGEEALELVLPEVAARRSAAFNVDYETIGES
jgi:hypothetical protein